MRIWDKGSLSPDNSAKQVREQAIGNTGTVTLQKHQELEKVENAVSDRFGSEGGKKQQ